MKYYVHYFHFSGYCPHLCRHVYYNVSATPISLIFGGGTLTKTDMGSKEMGDTSKTLLGPVPLEKPAEVDIYWDTIVRCLEGNLTRGDW